MTSVTHRLLGWRCFRHRFAAPNGDQLWIRVLGWDTCKVSVYRFTLRFLNPSLERGFAKSRFDRLVKSAATLSTAIAVSSAIALGASWYNNGAPRDAPASMHWGVIIAGFLLCLAQAIIMRKPLIMGKISPLGLEVYCVVMTILMHASAVALSPHYSKTLMGYNVEEVGFWTDTRTLFAMQLAVLGSHFVVVIRWHVLLVTELTPVLIYAAVASALGSPRDEDPRENLVALGCVTMLVCLGKRAMEYNERLLFYNLIQEQCLRCSSEFQLSQLQENVNTNLEDVLSTVDSRPETTESGRAFIASPMDSDLGSGLLKRVQSVGQKEQWLVSPGELKVNTNEVLGAGGFGTVVAGEYLGTAVAIKTPRRQPEGQVNVSHLLELCNECRIMRRLRHPNIVTFFGATLDTDRYSLALVLELVGGVTLHAFILNGSAQAGQVPEDLQGELCIDKQLRLLLDIVCAIRYLHSRMPRLVHGDLKDSNIFVEPWRSTQHGLRAKLLDFGLARALTQHARPLGGTLRWQAPEISTCGIRPEASADIFSVGRLVYFIITRRKPFHLMTHSQIMEQLTRRQQADGALYWPEQDWLSARARPLVEKCSKLEPEGRPDVGWVHEQLAGWQSEREGHVLGPPTGGRNRGGAGNRSSSSRLPDRRSLPTVMENAQLPTPGDIGPQLTRPGSLATPRRTQKLVLSWAISRCHFLATPESCCALHAGVQAWTELMQAEREMGGCADGLQEGMDGQCQSCGCLLLEPSSQDSAAVTEHACEICSGCPSPVWEEATMACRPRFGARCATLATTPVETQKLVLGELMLRLNMAMSPGDCCVRHAMHRNLDGLLAEVLHLPCHTLCAGDECPQQCTNCGLLLYNAGASGRSYCDICQVYWQPCTHGVSNTARASRSMRLYL